MSIMCLCLLEWAQIEDPCSLVLVAPSMLLEPHSGPSHKYHILYNTCRFLISHSALFHILQYYLLPHLSRNHPETGWHLSQPSYMPPMPRSPAASMMAKRCSAVLAFLLLPFPPLGPFFDFAGSVAAAISVGVAAPDGLFETSSKFPSPGEQVSVMLSGRRMGK